MFYVYVTLTLSVLSIIYKRDVTFCFHIPTAGLSRDNRRL